MQVIQEPPPDDPHSGLMSPEWDFIYAHLWTGYLDPVEILLQNRPITFQYLRELFKEKAVLHIAAKSGNITFMNFFIETFAWTGLDLVNVVDRSGATPLHEAARYSKLSVVKYLLENGANANAQTIEGYTPSMLACTRSDDHVPLILKCLVAHGANLHLCNRFQQNVLHVAVRTGNLKSIKCVIGMNRSLIQEKTIIGQSVEHIAAQYGNLAVIQYFHCDVPESGLLGALPDTLGRNVLHYAAMGGSVQLVQHLLDQKMSPWLKDKKGMTLIHLAAYRGKIEMVKYLSTKYNIDLNIRSDEDKLTPMHLAAGNNHHDMVVYLLKAGADKTAKDFSGRTAYDYAREREAEKKLIDLLFVPNMICLPEQPIPMETEDPVMVDYITNPQIYSPTPEEKRYIAQGPRENAVMRRRRRRQPLQQQPLQQQPLQQQQKIILVPLSAPNVAAPPAPGLITMGPIAKNIIQALPEIVAIQTPEGIVLAKPIVLTELDPIPGVGGVDGGDNFDYDDEYNFNYDEEEDDDDDDDDDDDYDYDDDVEEEE